jgi:alpha-L-rhamnosidase
MANKDTYPGWGDMLRSGATTMYESWDMDNSWCHSSYLYIGTWFIEGLAGIKTDLTHPGFKHFILKPGIVDDPSLKWVKAYHDCIYGRITSNWSIDNDRILTLSVTVPPNTMARLYLPTANEKTVTESNQPLAKANGIRQTATGVNQIVLDLQPGVYEFKSSLGNTHGQK